MIRSPRFLIIALLSSLTASLVTAEAKNNPAPRAPAPVSVSSINYANSSREELARIEHAKTTANPATPELKALAKPQRYVFLPGTLYKTDVSYEDMCKRIADVLEKKGFINAQDDQGRILDAENVDLVLRLHGGERPWRVPTARTQYLTWRDGLEARQRGRSLTQSGGDVFWDSRSGGNDSALGAGAANENAQGFGFGSSPGSPEGTNQASAGGSAMISQSNAGTFEYDATRDFFMIVIDAFDYKELKTKGENAKRLWTTFVAAPRQHNQTFSTVLDTMLRVATPYFGETTSGLQMYNDARATVNIREMEVLESGVKLDTK